MQHDWCQEHLRTSKNGTAIRYNYIGPILDIIHVSSMDGISLTYVNDEQADNQDYADNNDVCHEDNNGSYDHNNDDI